VYSYASLVPTPGDAYLASLPRPARRAAGAFYTPPEIVDYVVAEALALAGPRASVRALDPACGDGRFLAALGRRLTASGVRHRLVGVDRDAEAAAIARAQVAGADVRVGEALLGEVVERGAWDLVLGNPPWIRSIALKREDPVLWTALRGSLAATSFKEWDLYAAFLERAFDWLAPGGVAGLVVPSRWMTAAFAAPLRARLGERGAVAKIVDFGARQVFAGATTYTALVFLSRRRAHAVEVARFAGELPHAPDAAPLPPDGPGWERGRVLAASLGEAPWSLAVGAEARLLDRLRAAGPPLADVARVSKGAGTNADPVFVLPLETARAEGIEAAVLRPCLRGRDVRPFEARATHAALLPYDGDRLLAPDELAALYPCAAAYLGRHRALLERRERRRFAGPTFYRWGRPQNLIWLQDRAPKVVVPDAARGGRAALDDAGTLCLDTAYALRPRDGRVPIGLLLAVLNSPVVGMWLRATGVPLRGGYFRMKTAYLASLPLPDPSTPAARALASAALAPDLAPDALAARVLQAYGI
jgi:predicted RNA methylase